MAKKSSKAQKEQLFEESLVPAEAGSGKLFDVNYEYHKSQPVECFGMTFPNNEARRNYFTEILRKKLKDPEFRKIEGFPIGEDEDILKLSDPPYYTVCPNPFIADYLRAAKVSQKLNKPYHRNPYPAALDDSRNNRFVNAHSYATKVPHESVMRLFLHYTDPGDVVLDAFVGTGMTAVAAQLCGDKSAVDALGETRGIVGPRHAVVSDLGPAATHLSYNFNFPFDEEEFEREADEIANAVEFECGWMYSTKHGKNGLGEIICVLWSDVFVCGNCGNDVVFWDAAVDTANGEIRDLVPCPHCSNEARKAQLEPRLVAVYDGSLNQTIQQVKSIPAVIVYEFDGVRYEKMPDAEDLDVIKRIDEATIPFYFPLQRMPEGYNTEQPKRSHGLTHVHHFYTKRNLWALSCAWSHARSSRARFMLTSLMYKSSVLCAPLMSNYFASRRGESRGGWVGKERSGTLYCPAIHSEVSILSQIATRRQAVKVTASSASPPLLGVASATKLSVPDESIDYIFTDPPFGGNKMYSELAYMWEAWLGVFTNNQMEAITNRVQKKGLLEYESLMLKAFQEYYRVLKPGHWITVEFSNTEAAVWNALQNAIGQAGFVVADVRDLHKQQGSILGYTTTTATRQDLAISAYKPDTPLTKVFELQPGTSDAVWKWVENHLCQLRIFDQHGGRLVPMVERQGYILYDRIVTFHVQRAIVIPLTSGEFHAGLREKFPERDGMFFLPEQVVEYDRARLEVTEVEQLHLFISDERSSIQWIRGQLQDKPMTYQQLQPIFLKERVWDKLEQSIELRTILEQGFVEDDKGRWCVPDTKNELHLEQLRKRALLKEFQQYVETKGKLKVVRTEALRAGFKEAWQQKDYATIVKLSKRLPDAVIQEDLSLHMYYDNAKLLLGD
jgi:hypothetical protein